MFELKLTESDRAWLRKQYPKLKIIAVSPVKISGMLDFDMLYKPLEKRIKDTYEIEIEMMPSATSALPQVRELGSRIPKEPDRHINPEDEVCCLCSPFEEEKWFTTGFDFKIFLEQYVIPYFFAQTYFNETEEWPWGDYNHGVIGLIESYAAHHGFQQKESLVKIFEIIKAKSQIKGHWPCVCNSGKKIRQCHTSFFQGLFIIKAALRISGGKLDSASFLKLRSELFQQNK